MELNRLANLRIYLLLVSILVLGCTDGGKIVKKTYSGDGFEIEYPENWVIGNVPERLRKRGALILLEPERLIASRGNPESFDPSIMIFITISKRRIAYVPDSVNTYADWSTLQHYEGDYTVGSVFSHDVQGEPVTDIIYYRDNEKEGNCRRSIGNAYYFNKYLTGKENDRITMVIADYRNCTDKDLLIEAKGIMDSIKVTKYTW